VSKIGENSVKSDFSAQFQQANLQMPKHISRITFRIDKLKKKSCLFGYIVCPYLGEWREWMGAGEGMYVQCCV
jgi:hypothetical protein